MDAARLAVAVQERLVGALEEQQLDLRALAAQLLDDPRDARQEARLAGVDRERDTAPRRVGLAAQVEELLDEGRRQVVDGVEGEVLEGVHRGAAAAPREARHEHHARVAVRHGRLASRARARRAAPPPRRPDARSRWSRTATSTRVAMLPAGPDRQQQRWERDAEDRLGRALEARPARTLRPRASARGDRRGRRGSSPGRRRGRRARARRGCRGRGSRRGGGSGWARPHKHAPLRRELDDVVGDEAMPPADQLEGCLALADPARPAQEHAQRRAPPPGCRAVAAVGSPPPRLPASELRVLLLDRAQDVLAGLRLEQGLAESGVPEEARDPR